MASLALNRAFIIGLNVVFWAAVAAFAYYLLPYGVFRSSASAPPVFSVHAPDLDRLSKRSEVLSGRGGYANIVHFGQLHDRDADFTVALISWNAPNFVSKDILNELQEFPEMRGARYTLSGTYHDLATRFGAVHAVEFLTTIDGRKKPCLGFVSRFDTGMVRIKGWSCEASGARPEPTALACRLDAIRLDGRLPSSEAEVFLRERIRQPSLCSSSPVTQTVDSDASRRGPTYIGTGMLRRRF